MQKNIADINEFLLKVQQHCNKTRDDKYVINLKKEVMEVIDDAGFAEGFCSGNIIKYLLRFSNESDKKLDKTGNSIDLYKLVHYAGMLDSLSQNKKVK